jgi:gliding motility-associated-like protein
MRKFDSSSFLRNFFLFSALLAVVNAGAQTVVINTGTAGTPAYNAGPIYRSSAGSAYDASRYTYLYTSSELSAAGITTGSIITVVGWTKNNSAASTGGGIFRVFMKNSAAATFATATETWANLNAGATMVYENLNFTVPATTTPDYITFPLTTQFTYTGGSLEISTEWDINQVSGNPSTGTFEWLWSTVPDRIYGTGQTVLANAGTLSSTTNSISAIDDRRPFIQITYTPGGPCTSPPTPGTITASAANACLGIPFSISYSGGTNGTGQTYQWQSSPDGVTSWTDIPGETNITLNTSQLATTFYRLVITCSGNSVNSNTVQVFTAAAVSGTFTINSALPTGGTNFASFNDAYNYIKCGINGPVIFNVDAASGPYTEQLIMEPVPGASAINTVSFNGTGRTIQFTSTNTNERGVIKLDGADHIKFDNLVIAATGTTTSEYGFGVHLTNDADSNAITNCTINITDGLSSTNYAGIAMSASATSATGTGTTLCDGNVITGNTITGGYYGITLVGSSTSAVRENIVKGNHIRDFYFYGIYMTGNYASLIDSNTLSRPTRTTVSTFNGIYMTGLSTFVNITRNTIKDPFGGAPTSTSLFNGIFLTGVDALSGIENKVINNKIHNISGTGEANGINITGSDNVLVQHNTILMDGPGSSGTALTRGFYQTTLAAGITFENNIVSIRRGGSGAKYALYHNTTTSDIVSNRNDLYLNSPDGNTFIGYYGGAQATLPDWQTASGGDDLNSVISSPFFANAAAGDLTPTNAGIDNLGAPLGVLIDITGAARSATTPDLGAYEFTPGNCSAPATPGDAMVNQPIVCENTVVQFSLIGNSTGLGQTYQWQFASTIGGPYTNIGTPANNSGFTTAATSTLYYRAAVTCSGNTEFSTPVLLTVNPALPAGTYTIDKTQPTAGTNYNSFADAGIAIQCGIAGPVIFNVVAATGPYNEQFILGSIAGTSATNTITFNGNGNSIAYSSDVTGERAVIKLRDADHIIFDSLTIDATGAGTYGFGVHLINDADSNTFNRCTVLTNNSSTSTNFAGMVISGSETSATGTGSLCDGNTFSNNTINGGYYGITLVGSTTGFNNNNKAIANNIRDFYAYGVYTAGNSNAVIEGNDITRPTRTSTTTHYGIHGTGIQHGLIINANKIHGSFEQLQTSTSTFYGIYFTGVDADNTTPNIISNNLVYDVKSSGTQYGIYNTGSNAAKYYHNTIVLDADDNTETSAAYGFYQTTLADDIEVKDNIFHAVRAGSGDKYAIYFATSTSTITHDYNNLYVLGTNAFVGYNGTDRVNLAAWQAGTSQDVNSFSANSIFAGAGTGNYAPLNPVLDNEGTPVGITTDINSAPRSATTPDIGAYEFSIPPCTAPPAAGGATAIPNSGICMGAVVELSLAGYNIGAGQTYQWEFSTSSSGPWSPLGGVRIFPDTTIFASGTLYYRAAVTCSGNTSFSTPVLVTLNPAFLAGTYTINSTIPASAVNFTSFASAVAALECGITGPVFFDVAPNTYNEQIRMHAVAGTSPTVRVTFRSANGDPASVILTNNATVAASNYTLLLDSASYITYQNMTINATNTTNGRVVELANTASFDSIVNCIINAPVTAGTANTSAGIFADLLKGTGNIIKGNTVNNGNIGINLEGTSTTNLTYDHVIDSNTVNGSYYYGMYLGTNGRIKVNKNTVNVTMPRNTTNYGIYNTSSDSAYQFTANKILISGVTATTTYGMYFTGCDGGENTRGKIAGNTITALTANTGTLYGMYQTASTFNNTVNNVISISTTGATAYASYYTGGGGVRFQNNSIQNASVSTGTANAAAYFAQTSGTNPAINIQNNIFSHTGGGNAVYITNLNFIYSDYNTYYTASAPLFRNTTTVTYATLPLWVNFSYWDVNSINYQPKLVDNISLRPDLADPDVWAIHGRGTQIEGNDYDFDNNPRPTTYTGGVPDMGAYEFLPTSLPTLLTATPAAPAPGTTQTFMYGTDTVAKITYDATAPVPASINLRRYSGVLPTGLSTGQQSMYFYTDIDVSAQGAYKYDIQQFYIDPWRGFIPTEAQVQLGKTDAGDAWVVQPNATTDVYMNIMADTGQVYIDRFTGLTGNPPNTGAAYTTVIDSSNRGTRFWVPYGHHYSMNTNGQDMWLYLSAQDSANVTVRINGTNWVRTYHIPANTVRVSDLIPKYGLIDARITDEGLFEHGISIVSDVPIVAYTHIYESATSGATMLLPVGVYGYEYQSLNSKQYYPTGGAGSYSWTSVMTDRDNTNVEITPSVTTRGGRPAGVPFNVTLMRGQVYNIMGTINGVNGTDLSGTKIRSVANANGDCYPIAVFSGSSRTALCNTTNGDNLIQQVFPSQAWGRKYLTFATASSLSNTTYYSNLYRVMVKDPTTVVTRNGVVIDPATLVVPGNYYEFNTNQGTGASTATYIESDKPVMMAQYMISSDGTGCGVTAPGGDGDPEMIYISPIEQGIKQAAFYNTDQNSINSNYVNIIIPTAGLNSLRIDGTISTFTDVFAHPGLAGYSCVRHNLGAAASQHTVTSDSAFTAITYGLGSVESYGYNAGTLVKNLNALATISNTLGTGTASDYTCVNAPFRFSILISSKPTILTWKFSAIPQLSPNVDSIQTNPTPVDSSFINNRWFYRFEVQGNFTFSEAGTFYVPILVTDPVSIEGCNSTLEIILPVRVIPAPVIDFAAAAVCLGNVTSFTGTGSTSNAMPISTWNWTFGDNTTGTGQNTTHTYATAGTFNVTFDLVAADGCIADTTKEVIVNPNPVVAVVEDSLVVCGASPATFEVQNPVAGVSYNWYDAPAGGTLLATGNTYTIPSVLGTTVLYVEPISGGGSCIGNRIRVIATLLPDLATPVAVVDSLGVDRIRFRWDAIPNALSYEVSINGGSSWITPSSGPAGLTHTVTGLLPLTDVTLRVRAIGSAPCQVATSADVTGKTLPDDIYIPNAFSPNGDGLNDVLQVYGYTIKSLRFVVFNQWGEKVFESFNQATGWNGQHKGKGQPSGVYMYVCEMILNDGTKQVKKGSINLVR